MASSSIKTPPDILCLYAARALRGFGDGFAIIILPVYLSAVGFSPQQIGIVASASLLGTAALTLLTGFVAPRFELRSLFLAGAALIVFTGLVFPAAETFAFVAADRLHRQHQSVRRRFRHAGAARTRAADAGDRRPRPHRHLCPLQPDRRADRGGRLAGGGVAGAARLLGWSRLAAIKLMFYLYAALGLAAALLYRRLPRDHSHIASAPKTALGPSKGIVYRLAALFSMDAFAGGFVVQSLLALWLFQRFDLSLEAASLYFFASSLLGAFSFPVAAWLAGRIGLINTMVYTHIPSSLCLIAAAFSSDLTVVLTLLLVRSALSQMDVPTRSSYVMAVVTPAERTAAASVTAVPRSLASSISPAIAGFMLAGPFSGLPLVVCGVLKIGYDLALLRMFRHTKPPEEA